jgi:hypothetical protein
MRDQGAEQERKMLGAGGGSRGMLQLANAGRFKKMHVRETI